MIIGAIFLLFFVYIGTWLLIQHYHVNILMPFVVDVVNQLFEKQQIATDNYHEDKLLPSLSILSAHRAPIETNPPPVADEPPKVGRPQPIKDEAKLDKIWDMIKATY